MGADVDAQNVPKSSPGRSWGLLGASCVPLGGPLGGLLRTSWGPPGVSWGVFEHLGAACFSYHLPWDSMANRFWPCLPWNPMANAGQAIPHHNVYQFAMETAPAMDCHGISMANLSKIIHFQLLGPTCVCHGIPWQTGPTPHRPPNRPIFQPAGQKEKESKERIILRM